MRSSPDLYRLHAEVCKTLAHPRRLEIIDALRQGERSVGEMAAALGAGKANLSQHLALLRHLGIVRARREGANVYYQIANPKVIAACDLMREVLLERLREEAVLARSAYEPGLHGVGAPLQSGPARQRRAE